MEFLSSRIWTNDEPVEVKLELPKKYEIQAPDMKRLSDNGVSRLSIASLHRTSTKQVADLITFAETGKLPPPKKRKKQKKGSRGNGRPTPKVERYKELVVRLHDEEKVPFMKIRQHIKENFQETLDYQTIVRAYDRGNPEALRVAAENGQRPNRGTHRGLGRDVHRKIQRQLRNGVPPRKIAAKLGVGESTVRREKNIMDAERK